MPAAAGPGAAAADRNAVSFHLWQSLNLGPRLALSFSIIAVAFLIQAGLYLIGTNIFLVFLAGLPFLITGNLFLLVNGYDNRIDWKGFDPHSSWEVVSRDRLRRVMELDKALQRWDTSLMDVTSGRGMLTLLLFLLLTGLAAVLAPGPIKLLGLNTFVLIVPHWFTGTKRILRLPKLLVKADATEKLLAAVEPSLAGAKVEVYMLLKGAEKKVPEDVKFRISFENQSPDFLGLYGQTTTNDVQGRSYPYFYTVMVAKKGYGLERAFNEYNPPSGITKEYGAENEVEFVVVRQQTTKTSGYHTDLAASTAIFGQGLSLARATAE
jgi:hypothetical protein